MPYEDIHRPLTAAGFRGAIKWIIIVSGVMFVLQNIASALNWPLAYFLALTPRLVLQNYFLWQPVTYQFLHGGIIHWLFNMLVLWMFGRELEVRWGTGAFLRYFFICGLGAALCVILWSPHSNVPTIGASGAIFGLIVAFAMVFPEAVIYLYLVIPMKAWQAAILFGLIEFFTGLQGGGMSWVAHLGGMVTGYLYLRSGELFVIRTWSPIFTLRQRIRNFRFKKRPAVEFHEVTDDLVLEVDRILEKISKQGAETLTDKEKKLMERYSKLKH